ncbi:MAG TPA: c-type cytochrome [Nannocystaceae bacterium]|nr:c-type cytochrome [Nannocystaceae bacterium]
MRRTILVLAAAGGCSRGDVIESDWDHGPVGDGVGDDSTTGAGGVLDDRPAEIARNLPPISGGTLLVLDDDVTVVAADPDRDVVHVVSLEAAESIATIALQAGDEPGRSVQDDDGLVHVVLRGAGEVLSIDPADGSIAARNTTCANPRGIAWDPARAQTIVACAGGELVFHAPGGALARSVFVADDLRDVLVVDGTIRVSRFRAAELLTVADDGSVTKTESPDVGYDDEREPNTAWRTLATGDAGWLMLHQRSSTIPIPLEVPAYYDGGGGCFGPVAPVVALADASGNVKRSPTLTFATLAVDAAISSDGWMIALAIAGQSDAGSPTTQMTRGIVLLDTATLAGDGIEDCRTPDSMPFPTEPIAVAFTDDGKIIAQGREPASLYVLTPPQTVVEIALADDPRSDTGHSLFHQDAGTGVSCAGCHPEGGDDGRVWHFVDGMGNEIMRRTQSLRSGLAGTAPFHWGGDMRDLEELVHDIHGRRMGGAAQTDERIDAFEGWLQGIRPHNPERVADASTEPGRASFVARCSTCHGEDGYAGERSATIDEVTLQVPSLRGVALRAPFMHDGRSPDLRSAVIDMMRVTANPEITDAEVDDIVAFLETR